jgi:hypothetical protein
MDIAGGKDAVNVGVAGARLDLDVASLGIDFDLVLALIVLEERGVGLRARVAG